VFVAKAPSHRPDRCAQFELNSANNPAASIEWTSKNDPIGWWDGGTGTIHEPYTNCTTKLTNYTTYSAQGAVAPRWCAGCPAIGVPYSMDGRNPPEVSPFPKVGTAATATTGYDSLYLGGTVRIKQCCKDNLMGPGINARNGRSVDMLINVVPNDKQHQYTPQGNVPESQDVMCCPDSLPLCVCDCLTHSLVDARPPRTRARVRAGQHAPHAHRP
jgi:hypothetical protein